MANDGRGPAINGPPAINQQLPCSRRHQLNQLEAELSHDQALFAELVNNYVHDGIYVYVFACITFHDSLFHR